MPGKVVVYLIESLETNLIKIGISTNPHERVKVLNTMSPGGAILRYVIESKQAFYLEKKMHKHFSANRVNGEWFRLSCDEILAAILDWSQVSSIAKGDDWQYRWVEAKSKVNVAPPSLIYSRRDVNQDKDSVEFQSPSIRTGQMLFYLSMLTFLLGVYAFAAMKVDVESGSPDWMIWVDLVGLWIAVGGEILLLYAAIYVGLHPEHNNNGHHREG